MEDHAFSPTELFKISLKILYQHPDYKDYDRMELCMETNFENQVNGLLSRAYEIVQDFRSRHYKYEKAIVTFPEDYQKEFFDLIDKVNLSLMEDNENFFGYFLFQMTRELRFDISSPTGINFKDAGYVIYFNPILFLNLNINQMGASIKHEILHILSMHLIRAKEMKGRYNTLALNMAMDIAVNSYLSDLPPYATTLEAVNIHYSLKLEHYQSFEYYVDRLQTALALLEPSKNAPEDDTAEKQKTDVDDIETEYDESHTHDIWEESSDIDQETLQEFTEKVILLSEKGEIPSYIRSLLSTLKSSRGELPWNLYLQRLMGSVESNKKKTITRRNRRQPERLELRGELRSHKAKVVVAIDISGSISDEEFKQAMKEVLSIVKNYNHEITVIECDDEIRQVYQVKSIKDIKDRSKARGGTKFSPVFEYANQNMVNLLVYFTDGKGEDKLKITPRGYQIMWVISGKGETLSLKEPYGAVKKLSKLQIKEDILDQNDVPSGGFSMNYHEKMI